MLSAPLLAACVRLVGARLFVAVSGDVGLVLSCGVLELVEASLSAVDSVDAGGEASGAGDTDVDGSDGVSVDAWVRRLAQVGEVVWGAARGRVW